MYSTSGKILSYCYSVIGCSYSTIPSGGTEYESYNCSYLSYCAYASSGLDIPTWQGHQNGDGSQSDWVRRSGNWKWHVDELKPADLVFFGSSPFDTYHVGIYVGDGMMIDSVPKGGVQKRFVYDTFVGGGWPFVIEMEPDVMLLEGLLNVEGGTQVYFDGQELHDITDIEGTWVLDKICRGFNARDMPRCDITQEDYARLCQIVNAGTPVGLREIESKYPIRSRKV